MKIGMVTDSLGHLTFDELLVTAAELGLERLEFGCGNWSQAPHLKLDTLLESESARREFTAKIRDHGLAISALNCSGNQLAPGAAGKAHETVVRKTFQLAKLLDIHRVVMMSGLPAAPGDSHPNWITVAWPPEVTKILTYQWDEVAIPYWRELVTYGSNLGVNRICIELHGQQLVYNTETVLKMRDAVGENVGANFDPSHMMWMGGEPLTAIRRLREAIFYVHAKDTRLDRDNSDLNGLLETKTNEHVALGIVTPVLEESMPAKERPKAIFWARVHVSLWLAVIALSLVTRSWLPVLYIILPNFYGGTFLTLCGLTQHSGLAENEKDHRLSTRTVILNPVLSFLYCHMEYHIEHHIFPLVPCHNLKQLHEAVKGEMPEPRQGSIGAYQEIIPAVIKQGSDAGYCIHVQVPA